MLSNQDRDHVRTSSFAYACLQYVYMYIIMCVWEVRNVPIWEGYEFFLLILLIY